MKLPDKDILLELKTNNNNGFATLYKQFYKMVEYFVNKNNGSNADAADVFQDTLVVLYKKVMDPNFTLTATLKTFIYSISRNIWLNELRKKGKTVGIKDFENVVEVKDEIEEKQLNEVKFNKVNKAFEQLGEPCATIIKMFYYHKQSIKQIAEKFDYKNEASAKNQKYKCLQRLKKLTYQ